MIVSFPPLAYKYCDLLVSRVESFQLTSIILRQVQFVRPGLVNEYVASSIALRTLFFGSKASPVLRNKSSDSTILIYSNKFGTGFRSSQECLQPIIASLVQKFDVIFIHEKNQEPDQYYKELATCIPFDSTSNDSILSSLSVIRSQSPCALIPLAHHPILEAHLSDVPLFSIFPWDSLYGVRALDFRLSSCTTSQLDIYHSGVQILDNVPCTIFPPAPSEIRSYPSTLNSSESRHSGPILLGAFCRLQKLDWQTLSMWAATLQAIPQSILVFSYIASKSISHHYLRLFFNRFGISDDRIAFINDTNTTQYLKNLSLMHLIFGSTPEQGGVSFTDAILCLRPYIINSSLSSTTVSSYYLSDMGLKHWDVSSVQEFINIAKLLTSKPLPEPVLFKHRDACLELGTIYQRQWFDAICNGINKISSL